MTDRAGRFASWRARLPVAAVVVACVAGVAAAVTGAANPVSAVQFLLPGHWVYNSALQTVFHVDGSTGGVDARAGVPGDAGDQVFQGDTSGYVVGSSRITEFGKSSLSVEGSTTTVSRAQPVGVETAGGPYLVYREDGMVVRLGDRHAVLSVGGPVGTPVATRDGTLWLPRTGAGLLCRLPVGARTVTCPVSLPKGHPGGLSVVGDRVVFVDTGEDTVHVVEEDGLGAGRDLGVDARDDARVASTDVAGRLAILDGQEMHLVDAGLSGSAEPAEPVTVDLGDGRYTGPVSSGSVVAVVNSTTGTLLTYDGEGRPGRTRELPPEQGDPRLTRGEDDRIYVDGAEGEHVVVVDKDGDLTDVPIQDEGDGNRKASPPSGRDPDARVVVPPRPETEQPETEQPGNDQRAEDQRRDPPPQQPPPTTQQPPPTTQQPPPTTQEPPPPPPEVPPSPPGAPTAVSATAGNASATVNWGPAPDNRSPITGYTIAWAGGSVPAGPAQRSVTVPGLANGTTYVFTVTATNGVGAGPNVSSNPVVPTAPAAGPPAAPTNLAPGYDPATRDARFTFTPPDLGGNELVHHVVTVTGVPDQYLTEPVAVYDNIPTTGPITFAVRTDSRLPDGTILHGETASVTVQGAPAPGSPVLTLSRGPATSDFCGPDPACAFMHVVAENFPPNTSVKFDPHSTQAGYGNPGHRTDTDANGFADTDQFAYAGVGYTVWVTATLPDGTVIESNRIVWRAG